MIKDVFKFKKRSWHARLMKFVWGYTHNDFRNMCPYFWLSVFNVVFILPILVIKLLGLFVYLLVKATEQSKAAVDRACENKVVQWVANKLDKIWEDPDLLENVARTKGWAYKSKDRKYAEIYQKLSEDERSKLLALYYERLEERQKREFEESHKRQKAAQEKQDAKAAKIGRITVKIKKVFNIIIWPILAYFAYLLILMFVWLGSFLYNADYTWLADLCYVLYIFGGTALGLFCVIYPIVVFCSWLSCKLQGVCIPCERRRQRLRAFFSWFSFLKWPFVWIGMFFIALFRGIKTIWEIIIAFKKDNCPGLEWED